MEIFDITREIISVHLSFLLLQIMLIFLSLKKNKKKIVKEKLKRYNKHERTEIEKKGQKIILMFNVTLTKKNNLSTVRRRKDKEDNDCCGGNLIIKEICVESYV